MSFSIEPLKTPDCTWSDTLPSRIFREPGIALVASGSPACLRTLYFQAKHSKKLPFFFWSAPTAKDYSLGCQNKIILDTIRQAANTCGVRGVIFYASCLEVITMWDFERNLRQLIPFLRVPVRILYRGPLVKRLTSPVKNLENTLKNWSGLTPISVGLPLRAPRDCIPPPRPDFQIIVSKLANQDCDVFLFTPGGCKKCLLLDHSTSLPVSCQASRFDDIFLGHGSMTGVCQKIMEAFPETRPLYLLSTAIPYASGMDLESLADELRRYGKQSIYLPCNGFAPV